MASVQDFLDALDNVSQRLDEFGATVERSIDARREDNKEAREGAASRRRERRLIDAAVKLGGAGALGTARFALSGLSGTGAGDLATTFSQTGLTGLAGVANQFLFGGDPVKATGDRVQQALSNAIAFAPDGTDFSQQIRTLRDIYQPQENRRQRGNLQIQQALSQQPIENQGEAGKILGGAIEKLSDGIAELILFAGEFKAGDLFGGGR